MTSKTPYKPYGPKPGPAVTPRESLYPQNYVPDLMQHGMLGVALSSALIVSSYLINQIDKKTIVPNLKLKDIIPLSLVSITSTYMLDYLQRYEYIPYILNFSDKLSSRKN